MTNFDASNNDFVSQKVLEFYSDLQKVNATLFNWNSQIQNGNSSSYEDLKSYRNWALVIVGHVMSGLETFGDLSTQVGFEDENGKNDTEQTNCEKLGEVYSLLENMFVFFQNQAESLIEYFTGQINRRLNITVVEQ